MHLKKEHKGTDFIVGKGERIVRIRAPQDQEGLYLDGEDPSPLAVEGDRVVVIRAKDIERRKCPMCAHVV